MLLFDIIRDWFVMYIWGGIASNEQFYYCRIGMTYFTDHNGSAGEDISYLNSVFVPMGDLYDNGWGLVGSSYISLADWLSTTSTIIVMILLCVVFGLMVRWLFRLTAGLLRGN